MKKHTEEIIKINAILNSIYEEALKIGSSQLVDNNEFKSVLRVSRHSIDELDFSFKGHYELYTRVGYFEKFKRHYVTLLHSEIADIESDFYSYDDKESFSNCSAIIAAKRYIRGYYKGNFKGFQLSH